MRGVILSTSRIEISLGPKEVMKDHVMNEACSSNQFEQHRRISGVIQNSRDTASHQEQRLRGKI